MSQGRGYTSLKTLPGAFKKALSAGSASGEVALAMKQNEVKLVTQHTQSRRPLCSASLVSCEICGSREVALLQLTPEIHPSYVSLAPCRSGYGHAKRVHPGRRKQEDLEGLPPAGRTHFTASMSCSAHPSKSTAPREGSRHWLKLKALRSQQREGC